MHSEGGQAVKVYIAGKITGNVAYRQQFAAAEARLAEMGHSVMNAAWLWAYPEFAYEDYVAVSRSMLERCEAILLLPFWDNSPGAKKELAWAEKHGLAVFDCSDGAERPDGGWSKLASIAAQERAEREARLGKGLLDTVRGWLQEALGKINEPGLKKADEAALRGELDALQRVYDYVAEAER